MPMPHHRIAVAIGLLTIVGFTTLASAEPASAHAGVEQLATNWRSNNVRLSEPYPGISVAVTEMGDQVELRNQSEHTVVVLGYSGEPYLRITNGGVQVNAKSPAAFINRSENAPSSIPQRFDVRAVPRWFMASKQGRFSWHDHRAHHGTRTASDGRQWHIPLLIEQRKIEIVGQYQYAKPDAPFGAMVGLAFAGALAGFAIIAARRNAVVITLLTILTASAVIQLIAQWNISSQPFADRLGVFAYGMTTILAAAVAALVVRARGADRSAPTLLFCAVAVLVCGGFAKLDWLTHSWLPTTLPYPIAQAIIGLFIAGALGLMAIAAFAIARPQADDKRFDR